MPNSISPLSPPSKTLTYAPPGTPWQRNGEAIRQRKPAPNRHLAQRSSNFRSSPNETRPVSNDMARRRCSLAYPGQGPALHQGRLLATSKAGNPFYGEQLNQDDHDF